MMHKIFGFRRIGKIEAGSLYVGGHWFQIRAFFDDHNLPVVVVTGHGLLKRWRGPLFTGSVAANKRAITKLIRQTEKIT